MVDAKHSDTIQDYVEEYDLRAILNKDLLGHLRLFRFPAYSYIYVEGDEQHYLYFLIEGQVQCSHFHANGRLAVIALTNPFAVIGEFEILDEDRLRSNVIAMEDTVLLGIPREVVRRYGADDPVFLRFLVMQFRQKMLESNALQTSHGLPVVNRLAVYMLAQETEPDGTIEMPEKEALASLLGVTPRHLNRVLKEMYAAGLIEGVYPAIVIPDREALHELQSE